MIPDEGKVQLLEAQNAYLSTLQWMLTTVNTTPAASDTYFTYSVNEAAWAGYARQNATPWSAAAIVGGKAQSNNTSFPSFANASGAPQTFFVWCLVDSGANRLIAAVNIGSTTIPDGASFVLAPAITDDQA